MKAQRFKCPHCGRLTLRNKSGTVRVHFIPGTYNHCIVGGAYL